MIEPVGARRNARLYRLLAAYWMLVLVEWSIWFTVMLAAYEIGGPEAAGISAGLTQLPAIFLGPVAAAASDRIPRSRILPFMFLATGAVSAALALLLYSGAPLPTVVVAASMLTLCVAVLRPLHYSSLPALTANAKSLSWANSVSGLGFSLSAFLGPILAGLATVADGLWAVAAGAFVLMLVGGALCVHLPLPSMTNDGESNPSPIRHTINGLRLLRADRPLLVLVCLSGLGPLALATLEIIGITWAAEVLGDDAAGQGLVAGAPGFGAMLGAVLGAALAYRRRLAPVLVAALLAGGLMLLPLMGVGVLVAALIALAFFGLWERISRLATERLMQRSASSATLIEMFAVIESVYLIAYLVGSIGSPFIVLAIGPSKAYLVVGLVIIVVAALSLRVLRDLDRRAIALEPPLPPVTTPHRVGWHGHRHGGGAHWILHRRLRQPD